MKNRRCTIHVGLALLAQLLPACFIPIKKLLFFNCLTSTLVRESRESLASSVVGSRETNWLHSREHWATLARTLGYTRENTGLHSREHWATLARTLGYTRENTGLHSREHWATLARTLGYTREATWLHPRGHLATLARTISYTRELHTRGHLATGYQKWNSYRMNAHRHWRGFRILMCSHRHQSHQC